PRRDQLRGDVHGELREWYLRHVDCYSGSRLHLHRLDRRRLLGHWHLYRDPRRRDHRHRHLRSPDRRPHRQQGGHRERHGHQLTGGYHLRGDVHGELRERHHRDAHCYSCRRLHLQRLEWRRLLGHRYLRGHALRGDDGHRDLHAADLHPHGHPGGNGERDGHQRARRDQLRGDVHGELREWHGDHPERHPCRGLHLHGLERGWVLGHGHLHRDPHRRDHRHRHLRPPDRRAHRQQGGHRERHGHQRAGRDQLRRDLLGQLRERYPRHVDCYSCRRLHLQRLERRRLLGHRYLRGHALRGDDGHRDLHAADLHPHGHPGGNGERDGHQRARRDQLRGDVHGELRERHRRDAHCYSGRGLHLHGLEWRRLLRHGDVRGHGLRGDDGHRDLHAADLHPHSHRGGNGERDGHQRARRDHLRRDVHSELRERYRRHAHCYSRRG